MSERGGGGRGGSVVLPGLPVAKGSSVRDERALVVLLISAPADA